MAGGAPRTVPAISAAISHLPSGGRRGKTRAVSRSSGVCVALAVVAISSAARAQSAPPAAESGALGDAGLRQSTGARELLVPEYPPPSARGALALTGAAVFAGWYGAGVGASFLWPDTPGIEKLRIPVAGPWLALSETSCGGDGDCTTLLLGVRAVLTAAAGIGQLGGLAALVESAFVPTARQAERPLPPRASVRAAPFVAGRHVGLGVLGSF